MLYIRIILHSLMTTLLLLPPTSVIADFAPLAKFLNETLLGIASLCGRRPSPLLTAAGYRLSSLPPAIASLPCRRQLPLFPAAGHRLSSLSPAIASLPCRRPSPLLPAAGHRLFLLPHIIASLRCCLLYLYVVHGTWY